MIRLPLFKMNFKKNWVLLLIFFGVLLMYTTTMISMYDPEDMEAILSMLDLFPEELLRAMGFSGLVTDLTSYLASWLYGMLMIGFPMVYSIILGNRLVAKMVDNSSFAYLLSTPNSRVQIIVTQGLYALLSMLLLFAAVTTAGIGLSAAMVPGHLNVGAFLRLNGVTLLVNSLVLMISFFFSCLFNETKLSLGFGAGVPIAFFLMNMLGGAAPDAEILKRLSIFGLYDPVEVVHGAQVLGVAGFYLVSIAVLFTAGVISFHKKQLPL